MENYREEHPTIKLCATERFVQAYPEHKGSIGFLITSDEEGPAHNGNEAFPATTFQISNINGGTGATNVIPDQVKIDFNFRFSTENTSEKLQEKTLKILDQTGLEYELDWRLSGKPFLTQKGRLIEKVKSAIVSTMGFATNHSTSGSTSDGRFIAPTGTEVVELGPTNATIHQTNERLPTQELVSLTDIYYETLKLLLS